MHNDHFLLRTRKNRLVDDVCVLQPVILFVALESLALHPRGVQNIRVLEYLVQRCVLSYCHACSARSSGDALGHRERWRGDKVELDGVEAKQVDEAVDGAPVFEVTEQGNCSAVDSS